MALAPATNPARGKDRENAVVVRKMEVLSSCDMIGGGLNR